jgi:hypothetical protein
MASLSVSFLHQNRFQNAHSKGLGAEHQLQDSHCRSGMTRHVAGDKEGRKEGKKERKKEKRM